MSKTKLGVLVALLSVTGCARAVKPDAPVRTSKKSSKGASRHNGGRARVERGMASWYGGFFHGPSGFSYRDTDWYELDTSASPGANVSALGEYASLFGYINAAGGCGAPFFEDFLQVGICVPANCVLGPNPYWFFAATSGFGASAGACGGAYTISLTNYDGPNCIPVSVEEASWGEIKAKYSQR